MRPLMLLAASLLLTATAQAQPVRFEAGMHYKMVQPVQPTNNAEKIEVVEVFGYLCPHCNNFQPFIEPWSKRQADYVEYLRMPVVFQRAWEPFARFYYATEALGVLGQAHPAIFKAIHNDRQRFRNDEDLAAFVTQFGVSAEDYEKAAKSFAVDTKIRRATTMAQRYGVTGTPSVIINGKYLVTAKMAGGHAEFIEVIEYLVGLEGAELQKMLESAES